MAAIRDRRRLIPTANSSLQAATFAVKDLNLQVTYKPVDELRPAERNARTHSVKQLAQIAASIRQFGFVNPVLLDDGGRIVAGHGRVVAARQLGIASIPTICLAHLSEAQKRAYILADNKLAELAGWDDGLLRLEFQYLDSLELDFDLGITGFSGDEIATLLDLPAATEPDDDLAEPLVTAPPVSRVGDLWELGASRLLCGDARDLDCYRRLLGGETAQMVFTDPPYNVRINGHVSGLGRTRHAEFIMAAGEMSEADFIAFLSTVLGNLAKVSSDGAIHYVCMDWRHIHELTVAGRGAYGELKNVIAWCKQNGGMGAFYRSAHELIFVFKNGSARHINNFGLGETGRYRTNVWNYAAPNGFKRGRMEELSMHPTVKPVALVADAIRDCSKRKGIVLDAFVGSGTTLVAAHKTGRRGYGLELDPHYVDVAVRRWQKLTGDQATHAGSGLTFDSMAERRRAEDQPAPTADNDDQTAPEPGNAVPDPAIRVRRRPAVA